MMEYNPAERYLAKLLKDLGLKFDQQRPILNTLGDYCFKVDFLLDRNVVIELDGGYHNTEIQRKKTRWRDEQIKNAGYRIFHISVEDLLFDSKIVGEKILAFIACR